MTTVEIANMDTRDELKQEITIYMALSPHPERKASKRMANWLVAPESGDDIDQFSLFIIGLFKALAYSTIINKSNRKIFPLWLFKTVVQTRQLFLLSDKLTGSMCTLFHIVCISSTHT